MLSDWLVDRRINDVDLHPLYGNLSLEEQRAAIAPLTGQQAGHRKVVLATNIAETSLTIEGIRVVVDSGWCRAPRFDVASGMTSAVSSSSDSRRRRWWSACTTTSRRTS